MFYLSILVVLLMVNGILRIIKWAISIVSMVSRMTCVCYWIFLTVRIHPQKKDLERSIFVSGSTPRSTYSWNFGYCRYG